MLEGDTVLARLRCEGTQAGLLLSIPATGRPMMIDELYFFRIEGGRIARLWGLEDTWTRRRQLGREDVHLGELGPLG